MTVTIPVPLPPISVRSCQSGHGSFFDCPPPPFLLLFVFICLLCISILCWGGVSLTHLPQPQLRLLSKVNLRLANDSCRFSLFPDIKRMGVSVGYPMRPVCRWVSLRIEYWYILPSSRHACNTTQQQKSLVL